MFKMRKINRELGEKKKKMYYYVKTPKLQTNEAVEDQQFPRLQGKNGVVWWI